MATIQGVYLALFERPADPAGLAFFNGVTRDGADLTGIGDLAGQREYLDRFVGQTNEQIVRSIFRSLFNREGEQAGVDFFVGRLQRGEIGVNQIAINVLDGARNQDLAVLNAKLAAANAFTAAIDTQAEVAGYVGDAAAASARAFVSGVTTTAPTQAQVDAAVAAAVGGGGGRFTPDPMKDVRLVGTSGADVFDFGAGLDARDTVDGGAGRDTIVVKDAIGSLAGIQVVGVEVMRFEGVTNLPFDKALIPSIESIEQNSIAQVSVINFDQTFATDPFSKGVTLLNAGPVTVGFAGQVAGVTKGVLHVAVGAAGAGSALQTVAGRDAGALTSFGAETLNVRVEADANGQTATGLGLNQGAPFKEVILAGGAAGEAFALDGGRAFGTQALDRLDARTFLGDLRQGAGTTVAHIGLSGNLSDQTIVGGSGADNLSTGGRSQATLGDVLTGGAGADVFFTAESDSTAAVPNAGVGGRAFTAAELAAFTTITDLDLGSATGFVDRVNLAQTFEFAGVATVASATPTAMTGATFGAAVDALINNGVLDTQQTASGRALKVGLFTYGGETFLIANEAETARTGYFLNDALVLRVTNGGLGTLDAGDILLA